MDHSENEEYVKILFQFYSDLLDEETVETMWAVVVDKANGQYKLDSIPFYAPMIASDDIIYAEYDEYEERLTYRRTITPSGNSTIQVVLFDKGKDINEIRAMFETMGCVSERLNEGYFVMEVPADIDYIPVKRRLNEFQAEGILDYAEPCLSGLHRY